MAAGTRFHDYAIQGRAVIPTLSNPIENVNADHRFHISSFSAPIIQMPVSLAIILYTKVARATIQKKSLASNVFTSNVCRYYVYSNSRLHTFYTIRKNAEKNIAIIAENMLARKNRQTYPVCFLKH